MNTISRWFRYYYWVVRSNWYDWKRDRREDAARKDAFIAHTQCRLGKRAHPRQAGR